MTTKQMIESLQAERRKLRTVSAKALAALSETGRRRLRRCKCADADECHECKAEGK